MIQEIEGIKVVDKIKYLGIEITNKRNCLEEHKKNNTIKAKKYVNMMYSTIINACDRVLIGKTYWKQIAMPSFLYGQEIIEYDKKDLIELQKIDNQVYRAVFELPAYTAIAGMRADIGASSNKSRDMKSKVLYI